MLTCMAHLKAIYGAVHTTKEGQERRGREKLKGGKEKRMKRKGKEKRKEENRRKMRKKEKE